MIAPDIITASLEMGSALFGMSNIKAIRRDKKLQGVSWLPAFFYMAWGVYNLWFYPVLGLWCSFFGGMAITCVNATWLAFVFHYASQAAGLSYRAYARNLILEGIITCRASLQRSCLNFRSLVSRSLRTLSSLRMR